MKTFRINFTTKENVKTTFTYFGSTLKAAHLTAIHFWLDFCPDAHHIEIFEAIPNTTGLYLLQAYNLENGTWKKCFKNR